MAGKGRVFYRENEPELANVQQFGVAVLNLFFSLASLILILLYQNVFSIHLLSRSPSSPVGSDPRFSAKCMRMHFPSFSERPSGPPFVTRSVTPWF